MFIRVKKTPNSPRCSIQIVESTRIEGKVRQQIVKHVGVAQDDRELASKIAITYTRGNPNEIYQITLSEDEIIEGKPLLKQYIKGGQLISELPTIHKSRNYALENISKLPLETREDKQVVLETLHILARKADS